MSHWTVDPGSVQILGRTQTGKTSVARELHSQNDRLSIWLNERGPSQVPNVAGKRIAGLGALRSGMQDDQLKYNWLSKNRKRDIKKIQQWMWSIADQTDREFRMQLVVDEIDRLAPESNKDALPGRDELRLFASEGMKRNIKLIGITQDPTTFDKKVLRQREYLLCMPLASEHVGQISDMGPDEQTIQSLDQYEGVLYHADGRELETGVSAGGRFT